MIVSNFVAMVEDNRKIIKVECALSHSIPNTPITKPMKSFLQNTLVPKVNSPKWKDGLLLQPILDLSPLIKSHFIY